MYHCIVLIPELSLQFMKITRSYFRYPFPKISIPSYGFIQFDSHDTKLLFALMYVNAKISNKHSCLGLIHRLIICNVLLIYNSLFLLYSNVYSSDHIVVIFYYNLFFIIIYLYFIIIHASNSKE